MTGPDSLNAAVVIPAAGEGTRLGGEKKQFRSLGGKPLLIQAALRFQDHPRITAIAIAAPREEVAAVATICREYDLTKVVSVVPGGDSRQASIRAALESLSPSFAVILTHDAVRPFVSSSEIDDLLEALIGHRAAALAAPVTDTLCRATDNVVSERVDREGVFRLLTPQAFHREVLDRGHAKATEEGKVYTDEVTLARAMGVAVKLIPSISPNMKITTQADWEQAVWMWPAWEARKHK